MHGATSTCPTGYPIPRYVVAGGVSTSVTHGQSPLTESAVLGGAPILISANAAGLLSSASDGTSSSPIAYVRLTPQSGTAITTDVTTKSTGALVSTDGTFFYLPQMSQVLVTQMRWLLMFTVSQLVQ